MNIITKNKTLETIEISENEIEIKKYEKSNYYN